MVPPAVTQTVPLPAEGCQEPLSLSPLQSRIGTSMLRDVARDAAARNRAKSPRRVQYAHKRSKEISMTLNDLYRAAIEVGLDADMRGRETLETHMAELAEKYETMPDSEKRLFDAERLTKCSTES